MYKLQYYLIIGTALLLLSWSNFSKYCRHQMPDRRFQVSPLKADLGGTVSGSMVYEYTPYPGDQDLAGKYPGVSVQHYDVKTQPAATFPIDSSSKPKWLSWEVLKDVKYKKRYNKEYDQYFDYPVFGEQVKVFEGQKILIKGYIIPLDVGLYALSKNPYAACFFCGGAGPETIAGLTFARPPKRYKTDAFVTMEGVFRLNSTDVNKFMYQLFDAEALQ
ncbi:MAG: hypothetical protein IT260_03115 [Saprospiraceae bacterium]|nr:hypothetical protein [Saprospiraceae bacterium]